jgi:hypothetical protein
MSDITASLIMAAPLLIEGKIIANFLMLSGIYVEKAMK